jgi:transcriptional regulator with GAF, ATPase, and Fis domain
MPLIRGTVNGRAVLDQRTVHLADLKTETEDFPEGSEYARQLGHRTIVSDPLMREGVANGTICLRRTEDQLFTERQVALLLTFANQAVIAIENARLFEDVQARTKENRSSSRRRPPTSSKSSAARRSICRRCSTRLLSRRHGCDARPTARRFIVPKAMPTHMLRTAAIRTNTSNTCEIIQS